MGPRIKESACTDDPMRWARARHVRKLALTKTCSGSNVAVRILQKLSLALPDISTVRPTLSTIQSKVESQSHWSKSPIRSTRLASHTTLDDALVSSILVATNHNSKSVQVGRIDGRLPQCLTLCSPPSTAAAIFSFELFFSPSGD